MFDELEEQSVDVTPDSSDRAIAWTIWSRSEDKSLTPEEGWAILHERYPDEPRFLLLNAYAELSETRKQSDGRQKAARGVEAGKSIDADLGAWSPGYFLKKVERVLEKSSDTLQPHIRDLVVFGSAVLAGAKDDDAKAVADLRARIGADPEEPKRDERDRAGLRLRRFEREVLKEIDARTRDDKPLGKRAPAPAAPSPKDVWATAVADEKKPRKKYAADGRFEAGELVEHTKFGLGLVTGIEPGKVVILFESGTRKLVAGG
jgi:hypothetical protein